MSVFLDYLRVTSGCLITKKRLFESKFFSSTFPVGSVDITYCIPTLVTSLRRKNIFFLDSYVGLKCFLNLTTGAEDETYEAVITLLDKQFVPKSNISYERYLFQNFKQNSDGKIHQFYIRVMEQALKYDFGDTNNEIKQQLTLAINSNKLRRSSFCNPDITLENVLTHAKTLEDADSQAEEIENMYKDLEDINITR